MSTCGYSSRLRRMAQHCPQVWHRTGTESCSRTHRVNCPPPIFVYITPNLDNLSLSLSVSPSSSPGYGAEPLRPSRRSFFFFFCSPCILLQLYLHRISDGAAWRDHEAFEPVFFFFLCVWAGGDAGLAEIYKAACGTSVRVFAGCCYTLLLINIPMIFVQPEHVDFRSVTSST